MDFYFKIASIIVNVLGVVLVPVVLYVVRANSQRRTEEWQALLQRIELAEKNATAAAERAADEARAAAGRAEHETKVQSEEVQSRLERIENGIIERMNRLEAKLDTHLQWHLLQKNPLEDHLQWHIAHAKDK